VITEAIEQRAEELGIRLEYVSGIPIWEAAPVIRHQRITDRIRASITTTHQEAGGCGCIHYADIYQIHNL
jgi:hypothetical protein